MLSLGGLSVRLTRRRLATRKLATRNYAADLERYVAARAKWAAARSRRAT